MGRYGALGAMTLLSTSLLTAADEGLTLKVTYDADRLGEVAEEPVTTFTKKPSADLADLIRQVNGVSGIRMGGRGIDPVIRGQRETQLNVLIDGAFIHGGCPNRMDPPSTYASVNSYDTLTLIKGFETVKYGSGGTGGTVLIERQTPMFDGDGVVGHLSTTYRDNAEGGQGSLDLAAGSESGYVRVVGDYDEASHYRDGNGDEVRSSYLTRSAGIIMGGDITENTTIQASYDRNEERDVSFAGAGMDSPKSNADSYRLKLAHKPAGSVISKVSAELYRSEVDHLMDTARRGGKMVMSAPSESNTTGGRITATGWLGAHEVTAGVDTQQRDKSGAIFALPAGVKKGLLWPDVSIDQVGVFAEVTRHVSAQDKLTAGLRYDRIEADAASRERSFGKTLAELYGQALSAQTEHNVSGFLNWQHDLGAGRVFSANLSRGVRTADTTERYMAKANWIGNPSLDPEKHQQLTLTLRGGDQHPWLVSTFYNRIDDYILRYQHAGASRYKNVAAELYGLELEQAVRLSSHWRITGQLSYTVGNNLDDDQPLSRIAPLMASLSADYSRDAWEAGVRWNLAGAQNDVCLASSSCAGLDVTKTPGYGVVDLYAAYHISTGWRISAGVENIFDKTYRLHESRDDVFDPNPVQVNEPGRQFWLTLRGEF
ncbi:TonB-dependent copper receptor [Neptunomonas sp. XY-337]|uniref:TonB-dependent copper receptor n=1 Tax=Neptunomonas sp. XY-337 TaxID=2561897 RepID=UPI0010AABE37|nr:TonB-dependent copper receptor [Neptunomonas sp. XY-337]